MHKQGKNNVQQKGVADIDFNIKYTLDDQHYYQLPQLVPSNFKGEKQINDQELLQNIDQDLQGLAQEVFDQLKVYLNVWDVQSYNRDVRYYFNLPPTCFHQKVNEFQLPKGFQAYEYNAISNFSQQQLKQIAKTGTFEVPSRQFPIPYVWQISSWVIKGYENVKTTYYYDLARAYNAYRTWKAYIAQDRDEIGRNMTLRSGLYNIAIRPLVIFSILFGFKEMYSYVDEHKIQCLIEATRQLELQKMDSINMELYKFLKIIYKKKDDDEAGRKYKQILKFADEFNQEMQGLRLQMQNLYDMQVEKKNLLATEDEELSEQQAHLQEQINQLKADYVKKYRIYIDKNQEINDQIEQAIYKAQKQFWETSNYPKQLVSQVISLGDCLRLYEYHRQIYQQKCESATKNFQEQLKEKHKIKSKCIVFYNEQIKQFKLDVKKQYKKDFIKCLLEDLKQLNLQEYKLYEQFENSKQEMKESFKRIKKEEKERKKEPSIKLVVKKRLFPPYEVIVENGHYTLKRFQDYHVDSSKAGWKVKLMGVRYYVWTVNIIFWLTANAISGPIGIKALYSTNYLYPDVTCDYRTGIVRPSSYRVTPVIILFLKVIEGMRNSRCNFESSPDTGLFGKNFYRLFNLIEVYVFRFLLIGVLGVLIITPTIILTNFIISLALAITAWLWIPVTIILRMLFNSLIYDTDVFRRREKDIIWRSPNWFPLIINISDFLLLGVLNTLYCLFKLILWHPFLISFMGIFAQIRFYFRTLYDFITINIIKLLGRVPSSENNVAWKISGPGLSRQYFYGIQLPQVLVLVQGELERKILSQYRSKLVKLIYEPENQIVKKIAPFFSFFNTSFSFSDRACSYLSSQLDLQIQERERLFPHISHQIRFTEEELNFMLKQVKLFIKSQIELKDMKNYIWNCYNVTKGDYNTLTETIMRQIFGSKVLEPFEDIEMRFQLKVEQNFNFMKKVDRALDGEIFFQIPDDYTVQPKKVDKKNQVIKPFIHYYRVISEVRGCQDIEQYWTTLSNKQYRFYINYSLTVC